MVRSVLKDVYRPDIRLRTIVEPSFQPEFAVALEGAPGHFAIVAIRPEKQVWSYVILGMIKRGEVGYLGPNGEDQREDTIRQLEAGLPPDPAALRLDRCTVPVTNALAADLIAAWERMLRDVRTDSRLGLDGTTFHFSMETDTTSLVGKIWSPDRGSRTEKLVTVVLEMQAYCQTKDELHLDKLTALARELRQGGG
jgi:hypothetical protein